MNQENDSRSNQAARRIAVVFIVVGIVSIAVTAQETRVARRDSLLPILSALDQAKVSGSLRFSGTCTAESLPNFPKIRAQASGRADLLESLRGFLADDPTIEVMQDQDGTVRMKERGVPDDLLDVRIGHVSFGDPGTYSPNAALWALLGAPEIFAFRKSHEIEWPFRGVVLQGNLGTWPGNPPRISGSLDNVTLAEGLDKILKTFPGIWIYENCPRRAKERRTVYIHFYYLRRIGTDPPFVED